MSTEENVPQQTPGRDPGHEELLRLREVWNTRGKPLVFAAVLVIVVMLGIMFFRNRAAARNDEASQAFLRVRTAAELEDFMNRHGSTPSGPLALLRLAKASYNAGSFDVALNKYIEFEARYPKHEMAAVATVGKAHCLEAKGNTQDALTEFSSFCERNPDHFLEPQALFGKARCLEALGRRDDARVIYEDFVAARPGSEWASAAEDELVKIEREKRAGAKPRSQPANAVPDGEPATIEIPSLNLRTPAPGQ
jgi:predicted negative regulator of RcsB-dependent stress response